KSRGNIASAARMLGINRSTLYYRLRKHGLEHLLPTKSAVGTDEPGGADPAPVASAPRQTGHRRRSRIVRLSATERTSGGANAIGGSAPVARLVSIDAAPPESRIAKPRPAI